ncbi:MAG TPA: bifunctional phosphoribosylaminoimidazolecarboxamide formyltransferase/IMP cyclohydrolase [Candidatus Dormibacteraeota bacterium]|nr:bifunctional phosphoribosylaminoimidazolecarboxamide formyltransferase/IMP cyclohydrolase [Candidatus Dormibacteraeota bacterium]
MSSPIALLGVDDKAQLPEFARGLHRLGFELLATGGTERVLRGAGLPVTSVASVTGVEEMLEGRVKTLHPAIHAGILARRDRPEDMATLERLGFRPIDLVVVNLYPFAKVVAAGSGQAEVLEAIDIGGPTLLRAAAKNFASVGVVSSPDQYEWVLAELVAGGLSPGSRRRLAAAVFELTSTYDALVGGYLTGNAAIGTADWPPHFALGGELRQPLRYGENPHQPGAFYQMGASPWGLAATTQLQGGQLSYTNWLDTDAAWRLVSGLDDCAAVVVKHTNPCGVALAPTAAEAFQRAYDCDPRSAYGGIVALNRALGEEVAAALAKHFLELVIAPSVTPAGMAVLAGRQRLRVLAISPEPPLGAPQDLEIRSIAGGLLIQSKDPAADDEGEFRVVSKRPPTDAEWRQLRLAWRIVRAVKSNAIVLCRDDQAVGIGAGQMSRVEAVELALRRAGDRGPGTVLASDAFFPMPDGLEIAAQGGVSAAIHPGGSMRDPQVLAAADAAGMALITTGRRHFRH